MSVTFKKSAFAGLISAALLAGCGGGGGSAATPTNSTPVGVSVTSTNAADAVAYAYSGAQSLGSTGASGVSSGVSSGRSLATGVSVQTSGNGLITASLQQLYKGLNAQPLNNLVTGVTASSSCTGGGTISETVNLATPGQISNGDSLSITSNSCVENSETLNGTISYTFNNITGTIGSTAAWSATLALNYSNLSLQSGSQTLSANGDLTMTYGQTANAATTNATESGSSLQMKLTYSGGTISRTMTAYDLSDAVASNTDTFSANYSVTGSAPSLGNTAFTVKTPTPFISTGTAYPSTGSMTVTASDKSSATLTAIDSINVRIDIDTNGDGVIDKTINTTWADLSSRT